MGQGDGMLGQWVNVWPAQSHGLTVVCEMKICSLRNDTGKIREFPISWNWGYFGSNMNFCCLGRKSYVGASSFNFLSSYSLTQIAKITAHLKTVNAGVSMSQFHP